MRPPVRPRGIGPGPRRLGCSVEDGGEILAPLVIEIDEGSSLPRFSCQPERREQDAPLRFPIARAPERVAHGKIHERRARRPDLSREVPARREQHRRDTGLFDHACDQTDRLVIEGSGRDQHE